MNRLVPGLLACSFAAGQAQRRPGDSVAVAAAVHAIVEADNARSIDRVMRLYSDSAWLLPPGEAPVTKRSEIRARYEALFGDFTPAIVSRIDELRVEGQIAWVVGQNTGAMKARVGSQGRTLNDWFVMVVIRERDQWRIHRLIWSPMRAGAPAKSRGPGRSGRGAA